MIFPYAPLRIRKSAYLRGKLDCGIAYDLFFASNARVVTVPGSSIDGLTPCNMAAVVPKMRSVGLAGLGQVSGVVGRGFETARSIPNSNLLATS